MLDPTHRVRLRVFSWCFFLHPLLGLKWCQAEREKELRLNDILQCLLRLNEVFYVMSNWEEAWFRPGMHWRDQISWLIEELEEGARERGAQTATPTACTQISGRKRMNGWIREETDARLKNKAIKLASKGFTVWVFLFSGRAGLKGV